MKQQAGRCPSPERVGPGPSSAELAWAVGWEAGGACVGGGSDVTVGTESITQSLHFYTPKKKHFYNIVFKKSDLKRILEH